MKPCSWWIENLNKQIKPCNLWIEEVNKLMKPYSCWANWEGDANEAAPNWHFQSAQNYKVVELQNDEQPNTPYFVHVRGKSQSWNKEWLYN